MRQSRPNVIVFLSDQQRYDSTGVHGNPMELTPNFDRCAATGTHLFNAFACQPLCGPARAAMQTGRYATQAGVFRNETPLPDNLPTLASTFAQAGYRTGYIGKWHLGGQEPVPPHRRGGYQDWLAADVLEFESDAYDTVLFDENQKAVRLPGYRVDALTDAAIRYIDKHKDEPFLLFLSFLEPHHQNHTDNHPAPDGYEQDLTAQQWVPPDLAAIGGSSSWHLGGYYGMVKRLDEAFGRLMDTLRSLGLSQNTIVMSSSDHGSHFKTRNAGYKHSCHESSIRVPAMITGPGFMGGGQVRALFSTPDMAPTLLDAAGLDIPDSMTGCSIVPVIRDARSPWRREAFIQTSLTETGRAIRTERWKYGVLSDEVLDVQGAESYREAFLFDLETDPYELVNLVGMPAFRDVSDDLKSRLLAWIDQVEGLQPEIIDAAPAEQRQRRLSHRELWRDYQADTSLHVPASA